MWLVSESSRIVEKVYEVYQKRRNKGRIKKYLNLSFVTKGFYRLIILFFELVFLRFFSANKYKITTLKKLFFTNYEEKILSREVCPEQKASFDLLSFSPSKVPLVSIIIPVFNQLTYTLNCLSSLKQNISDESQVEIIVVNDNSNDKTYEILSGITGISIINNVHNEGFIVSCNIGSIAAKGSILCFLNNDTQVQQNWLESVLPLFHDQTVGAVGSMLVYPDDTLQEAGGVIWEDGGGLNYGRNANPMLPEYNFVREVDYCSGASLFVRKEDFEIVGRFDLRYKPAYYEDTDLCFKIRYNLKHKVLYQPYSKVIHFEGISSGRDVSSGIKKYQLANGLKFQERWKGILKTKHFPAHYNNLFKASRKLLDKKTIVIIYPSIPAEDKDSGSRRMMGIMRILKKLDFHIVFIPHDGRLTEPYTTNLRKLGIEILYTNRNILISVEKQLTNCLKDIDYAWVCFPNLMNEYYNLIRQNKAVKIIYDTIDVHFVRFERKLKLFPNDRDVQYNYKYFKDLEIKNAIKSDATILITKQEEELFIDKNISNTYVVPNIHTPYHHPVPDFNCRKDLLFIGGYSHEPNIDAAIWLIKDIMPKIWESRPEIKITLLGSNPPDSLLRHQSNRIIIPGFVEDVSNYFLQAKIFVAPLRYGAGMKGKVGQALEYYLPIITTSIGAEGMGFTHEENILIGNTTWEIVRNIIRLYDDQSLWEKFSNNSLALLDNFSDGKVRDAISRILQG